MSIKDFSLVKTCFKSNLSNICYFGYFDFFLGSVFLVLNCYGFIKMTKFYKNIKFENMLILLTLIQLIIFLISMFFVIGLLLYLFIFLQIIIICLINNKFTNMSKGFVKLKFVWLNKVIMIFNILYLLTLIVLYALKLDNDIIFCCYYILELIDAIILAVYCCKFLNIIKKKLYDKNRKSESNPSSGGERKSNVVKNTTDNIILFNFNSEEGDELFYIFKKRQLTLLYLANIICTILESGCIVGLMFIDSNDFILIIVFSYFFITVFDNIISFLCFFWIIRNQYNKSLNLNEIYSDTIDEEGLIDDRFIEEEVINIEKQKKIKEGDKNLGRKTGGSDFIDDFEE